jgi:hypothetical protein
MQCGSTTWLDPLALYELYAVPCMTSRESDVLYVCCQRQDSHRMCPNAT